MNKAELITVLATKLEVSKAEGSKILSTVLDTIIESTVKDGECVVPGLGKLVVADTAARQGVTSGVAWSKPASKTVKLRLSKAGKELAK